MGGPQAGDEGQEPALDLTVVGVAIAGIVSVVVSEDDWDLFDSMVGVTLILLLIAYGRFRRQAVTSWWEALAVAAVWSFCLVLVFGPVIDRFQEWARWPPLAWERVGFTGFWFAAVWLALLIPATALLRLAGERLLNRRARSSNQAKP